jgi:hypothetical protein
VFRPAIKSVSSAARLLAVVGILLVGLSGFAQAVHVHPDDAKLPSHECSLCSVAHSGAIASVAYQPTPESITVRHVVIAEVLPQSSAFVFFLRIRPPPTV